MALAATALVALPAMQLHALESLFALLEQALAKAAGAVAEFVDSV